MAGVSIGRRYVVLFMALSLVLISEGRNVAHAEGVAEEPTYLPVLGNRACHGTVPPTLFGVQMYGETGRNAPYFTELMTSGATWVRVPVAWARVEPENTGVANFDWRAADRALAVAKHGCLNVIATHRTAPSWAAQLPDGPVYQQYLDDLAEYLAALVERYDGDGKNDAPGSPVIRYWEIYNEPDSGGNPPGWGREPERYAEMLKLALPAIRSANRDAKVVLGGLAYDWFSDDPQPGPFRRTFLQDVVDAGGGDHFDIMNFHYFPDFAPVWASYGPGLVGKTRAIRQEMARIGLSNKPIIVTETGHYVDNRPPYGSSEELHMRYVVVNYTQAMAAGVQVAIWFTLNDRPSQFDKAGLVTADIPPRKRPAFYAYQVAHQQLATSHYVRRLATGETGNGNVEAYLFDSPSGKRLYVAWLNPVRLDDSAPLTLPGAAAIVRNVFGDASIVRDGHDGSVDGRVTVWVSGRPIYVEME